MIIIDDTTEVVDYISIIYDRVSNWFGYDVKNIEIQGSVQHDHPIVNSTKLENCGS